MSVLERFAQSRVVMSTGDHPPAHVHVQLRDGRDCRIDLHSLTVEGTVAPRDIREERLWIASNRERLRAQWRRLNP
jgi:hypothetical protein